jgi:serine/threonine protein kinase
MADERRCPRCGAVLPRDGECSRCLLALGLTEGVTASGGFSPPEPDDLPERVGPYRILDTLASSETGVVYLGETDPPARRRAAVKVVPAERGPEGVLGRFAAERVAVAAAGHAGIVQVLEVGETEDGRAWFAMELVRGVPITEHCDRERLTVRQRLLLFVEVCELVQHAHARGAVHGGLKPANVLVSRIDGRARVHVLDFAIARALGPPLTSESLLTPLALLVGAPGYVSPEQLDSPPSASDPRSDVYALGALLYELLAGEAPFHPRRLCQKGWAGLVRTIQTERPLRPSIRVTTLPSGASAATRRRRHEGPRGTDASSWSVIITSTLLGKGRDRRRAAPHGGGPDAVALRRRTEPLPLVRQLRGSLDAIVLQALAKDPTQRYASVADLAADVERHLRGEPVLAAPRSIGRWLLSLFEEARARVRGGGDR